MKNNKIDIIISNPPFSIKTEVLEHTVFNLEIPFIYLLPLDTLSSAIRKKVLITIEDDLSILFFNKRTNFMNPTKFNNKSGFMSDLCFLTNIKGIKNKMLIINDKHKSNEDNIIKKLTKNSNKKAIPTIEESKWIFNSWIRLTDRYYNNI